MFLVSLLATVALVSMQYGFVASALIPVNKGNIDSNFNVPSSQKRRPKKFVHISAPPPEALNHQPGENLALTCEVMGSPAPTVQWMKNGKPLDNVEESANEIITVDPSSLASVTSTFIISEPSPNPEDIYTCLATSGAKKVTASSIIFTDRENAGNYLQALLAVPPKPRITYFYNAVFQEMSTDLLLPCRVTSALDVQVYWKDNAGHIILDGSRAKMLQSGDLYIPNLQWADMGEWTCVAKNYLGEDVQSTFLYPTKA